MSAGVGWESAKENIQPLSSGRKMATMSESLPSTHHHESLEYESYHLEEVSKMEMMAQKQLGNDPLQQWVDVITYMDQHFLSMSGKVQTKYNQILKSAVQSNFSNGHYKNDKRLAKLMIKSFSSSDTHSQIKQILKIFEYQIQTKVSVMYTTLADLYEKLGNEKMAAAILRRGKELQAEPLSELDEKLTHIENRWAENYAKQLAEGPSADSSERFVAASVPVVGENNEAISIRQNLQPAKPLNSQPKPRETGNHQRHLSKMSIYVGENNSSVSVDENIENVPNVPDLSKIDPRNDAENNYDPTRWNAPSTQLDTPAIPAPCEKLQLYVDPDSFNAAPRHLPVAAKSHADNRNVLQELKDEPEVGTVMPCPKLPNNCTSQQQNTNNQNPTHTLQDMRARPRSDRNFFVDVKYKVLPRGSAMSYTMMNMQQWKLRHEEEKKRKIREFEENEINKLRQQIKELTNTIHTLESKLRLEEVKQLQQEDKIVLIESRNQDLINKLTEISTENNVRETEFLREKVSLEEEIQRLETQLRDEIQRNGELEYFKKQYQILLEEKRVWESENQYSKMSNNFGTVQRSGLVDVEVCSSSNYGSVSTEREVSTENKNNTQDCGTNSFLPMLDKSEVSTSYKLRERVPDSVIFENMNDTPSGVGSVQDYDMRPPTQYKPPTKKFSLYESFNNKSLLMNLPVKAKSENNIRSLVMGNIQSLSENQFPQSSTYNNENVSARHNPHQLNENSGFARPSLPIPTRPVVRQVSNDNLFHSEENRYSNVRRVENRKSRLSIRGDGDNLSDDDDIIVGQNQQGTNELTLSNLTTMLQLGNVVPLTNSTPEKKRDTFSHPFRPQSDGEEMCDNHNQAPRYSVLNEPQTNLSIIQETSRERSSRNTTSSSSSNNMTNYTNYYTSSTRSSSVPRGTSYSHQFNSNGYFSDTNHR